MPLTASEIVAKLQQLLGQVDCFAPPSASDAERWHFQKSALRRAVVELIEGAGGRVATPASPRAFTASLSDSGCTAIRHNGKTIPVERRSAR